MLKQKTRKISKSDIAAIFIFAAFFCYSVFIIHNGFNTVDEAFYFTLPLRLLHGDSLLVDEWHVSQLTSLFVYLPMKIFNLLNSSYDGIILYFRWLYLIGHYSVLAYLYCKIRKYGIISLFACFLYCFFSPYYIYTLNYYNIFIMLSVTVGILLFFGQAEIKPFKLILAGFLFACCVVEQPFSAFVYFFYITLYLIFRFRNKKGEKTIPYLLNFRSVAFITIGIIFAVICFVPVFVHFSSLEEIPKTFTQLFNDSEYAFYMPDGTPSILRSVCDAADSFGIVIFSLFILFAVLCFVLRNKEKCVPVLVMGIFVLNIAATVYLCINSFYDGSFDIFLFMPYRLLFFFNGLYCFILLKGNTDIKSAWAFGCLCTSLLDISSDMSVAFFSVIADISSVLMLPQLAQLIKNSLLCEKKNKNFKDINIKTFLHSKVFSKKSKFYVAAPFLLVIVMLFLQTEFAVGAGCFHLAENMYSQETGPLNTELTEGPFKGIVTNSWIADIYSGMLSDIDIIKENNSNGYLYIFSDESWPYIYADMDIAAYSTWLVDQDCYERQIEYWTIFPEKIPSYIYLPLYNRFSLANEEMTEERLLFIQSVADCEITKTDTGYICKVLKWHLDGYENFTPEFNYY